MYGYKPSRSGQLGDGVEARTLKLPFFALLIAAFLVGLFGVRLLSGAVYALNTRHLPTDKDVVYPAYEAKVSQATDSPKLALSGKKLLEKQLDAYAVLNFKRASDLDPTYRDAAYGWAYALLKNKPETLTQSDLQSLHTAIDRAEKVDPLYVPVLKLKKMLADLEHDSQTAQAAQKRIELVGSPAK